MTKTFHGIVHGKTIELNEELGIADGEEVEVVVRPTKARRPWGEGIKRSAGVAADEPQFNEVFEQIARDRKAATFREESSRVTCWTPTSVRRTFVGLLAWPIRNSVVAMPGPDRVIGASGPQDCTRSGRAPYDVRQIDSVRTWAALIPRWSE